MKMKNIHMSLKYLTMWDLNLILFDEDKEYSNKQALTMWDFKFGLI
jgi:hypothetical protein